MEHTNHLIHETSPYLQQHAHNPVNWYPWGTEAFDLAKTENKPVFLSIGYSSCHWCHVMRHESFEDETVAQLLNDAFICIKVDREERPDIDAIYLPVVQMMTGNGGWPATLILTPDKKPFFAATYIPKENRYGMKGFLTLIPEIKELWEHRRQDVESYANNIMQNLHQLFTYQKTPGTLTPDLPKSAYEELRFRFDAIFGGFSEKQKFPTAHTIQFLLHYYWWTRKTEEPAYDMLTLTLEKMRLGGIFDHVAGGFHRYTIDRKWLIPHFEKMLYDQASLLEIYSQAYHFTQNPRYKRTAQAIVKYLETELLSPNGGFYSSQDADSENIEGKYYTWSLEELATLLSKEQLAFTLQVYNVKPHGNYQDEATGELNGKNILYMSKPENELARDMNLSLTDFLETLENINHILYNARKTRVPPGLDQKMLADWNGLLLSALSHASQAFNEPPYLKLASTLASFIQTTFMKDDTLYHMHHQQKTTIPGFLDDYANVINGFLAYYEASHDPHYLHLANTLTQQMINEFWDQENHGFFFTGTKHESLMVRKKDAYDGAYPSGNSVAAYALAKLSALTGNMEYRDLAEKTINVFGNALTAHPDIHTYMLQAVMFLLGPTTELVIIGNNDESIREFTQHAKQTYNPHLSILTINTANTQDATMIHELAPFTKDMKQIQNKTTAFVCKNFTCNKPTTSKQEMLQQITSS